MARTFAQLAPGVHVRTSRVMHTTSTVVEASGQALLIDPAWLPDELHAIADWIDGHGFRVVGGFATHAHHDHLLWHPRFGDVPRWASAQTAALARSHRAGLTAALGHDWPGELADLMGRVRVIDEDFTAPVPIEHIVHDGHAPGHTALWLPQQRILVAGDMLSDIELPLPFDPDDVPSYVAALDRLAPYASRAQLVIPGHGTVGSNASARLDADRRYIEDMLSRGESDDPRRANPGMDAEYAHMQRLVREGT